MRGCAEKRVARATRLGVAVASWRSRRDACGILRSNCLCTVPHSMPRIISHKASGAAALTKGELEAAELPQPSHFARGLPLQRSIGAQQRPQRIASSTEVCRHEKACIWYQGTCPRVAKRFKAKPNRQSARAGGLAARRRCGWPWYRSPYAPGWPAGLSAPQGCSATLIRLLQLPPGAANSARCQALWEKPIARLLAHHEDHDQAAAAQRAAAAAKLARIRPADATEAASSGHDTI